MLDADANVGIDARPHPSTLRSAHQRHVYRRLQFWVGHASPQAPWFSVAGGLAMLALPLRYAKLPLTFTDMASICTGWSLAAQSRKSTASASGPRGTERRGRRSGVDSSGYEASPPKPPGVAGDLPCLFTLLSVDEGVQSHSQPLPARGSYLASFIPMLTKIYDGRVLAEAAHEKRN